MKLLYLDCFAGISGDMFLGALLDLGVSIDTVRTELEKLQLKEYRISSHRAIKQNIAATKFDITVFEDAPVGPLAPLMNGAIHEHRGYTEIAAMIEKRGLTQKVKERALHIFRRIGEAEAKIHGVPLEKIHFHEIGAVDSIVDIVGTCIAIELLGVDEIHASPPQLGSGFVETAHGRFPVPTPATLELLKGIPVQSSNEPFELVTPTGAALLAEFCTKFGPLPAMNIEKIGYGAGTRDLEKTPNVLRAVLGTAAAIHTQSSNVTDSVTMIETNVDDMNPQLFGDVVEQLLAAGALDVFLTAVQMKKNRPGTLLTVLCESPAANSLADLILTHTTSFGVRMQEVRRRKLAREIVKVKTRFGKIEVKIGRLHGKIVTRSPEFESCKQAAATFQASVKEVHREATQVAEEIV